MRDLKGIFPGAFTMANMFCGFLAIIACIRGTDPAEPAWLILLALLLDSLDGHVARISHSATRFGVELDSLSDLVSFGIAPAVMMYRFPFEQFGKWAWILGFVYIMAAAFRLARFNLQANMEKKKNFVGLPVPAAAFALAGYLIFCQALWGEIRYENTAVVMMIGFSVLMVSNIEYASSPKLSIRNKGGIIRLVLVVISIGAIIYKPNYAPFPVAMLYVLSGLVNEVYNLVKRAPDVTGRVRGKRKNRNSSKRKKDGNPSDKGIYDGKSLRFPEEKRGRSSGTND